VRKELIYIVKNKNEDKKYVNRAIELVTFHGGLEYAHKKMMEIKQQALDMLIQFPESQAKSSIIGLVEYTTQREK
jgi:octaprenyl-diphosphate synthase